MTPRARTPAENRERRPRGLRALVAIAVAAVAALLGLAYRQFLAPDGAPGSRPIGPSDFTGSEACASCHAPEAEAWRGSHHQLAMQPPAPDAVLGDFGGATFTHLGVTTRFFTRDGRYFVSTPGADGKPGEFEVRYVIGVRPVQQYVLALPSGKLQCLTVAWDTERRRWYSLYPDQEIALDDPLHWTGRYQNWNLMCAECHTTGFRKGYDRGSDSYRSEWAEFDVGCETCHGPGRAHVKWARRLRPGERAADKRGDPRLAVALGGAARAGDGGDSSAHGAAAGGAAAARAELSACAPCHSRRHRLGAARGPSDPFLDEFMPELIRDPLYFADGQMRDEVYEYGSFAQSRMYQQGVRCSDCHDPHSAKLRAEGNALCVRCHQPHPEPGFPTLSAKEYDDPAHHHHAPGTAGAQCVSCHMPERFYMGVDGRRDHFIRPPRPDESVAHGTPNACNGCHADRTAAWALGVVERWYGGRPRDSLFTRALAAGRAGARDAAPLLARVAEDRSRSAIARATALHMMRAHPEASASVLAEAARDPDPLVRAAAVEALETQPLARRAPVATPALADPVRAVRVAAARALAASPPTMFSAADRRRLEAALAEHERGLESMDDMPSTHLNRALLFEARGKDAGAEESYRTALAMDPYFLPARANLATLYNRTGRNADAERELREGIRRHPREGELHYSLGLLLAEEERVEEAARALAEAALLMPSRARVHYNLALALSRLGRDADADRALERAGAIDPLDPDILYATAFRFAEHGQWKRALPLALRLAEIRPGDPDARGLIERIRGGLGSGAP